MVMHWLIQEWIAQWLGLRDRLRTEPRQHDAWWLSIRERILRFMVSRYLDDPVNPTDASRSTDPEMHARAMSGEITPPPIAQEHRRDFCRAVASNAYGPRKCAEMEEKLRSVRRVNEGKRGRWRWF